MRGHWRVIKCIGHKTGFLWNFRSHQTRKFAESNIKSETQMRILYINPSVVSIVIHIMHLLIWTINSLNIIPKCKVLISIHSISAGVYIYHYWKHTLTKFHIIGCHQWPSIDGIINLNLLRTSISSKKLFFSAQWMRQISLNSRQTIFGTCHPDF